MQALTCPALPKVLVHEILPHHQHTHRRVGVRPANGNHGDRRYIQLTLCCCKHGALRHEHKGERDKDKLRGRKMGEQDRQE